MNFEDEMRRQDIVERAVQGAERIILDDYDGSREELLLLTALVAKAYVEKMGIIAMSEVMRKDLNDMLRGGQ